MALYKSAYYYYYYFLDPSILLLLLLYNEKLVVGTCGLFHKSCLTYCFVDNEKVKYVQYVNLHVKISLISQIYYYLLYLKYILYIILLVVSVVVVVAVPLASWGTIAATRVPRLRIGERPREWTRG